MVELVKPVGQSLGIAINALVNDEKGGNLLIHDLVD